MKKRFRKSFFVIGLVLIVFLIIAFFEIKQALLSPNFDKRPSIIQVPCQVCADDSECPGSKICVRGCCKDPQCGDGIVTPEAGEQCEPGQLIHSSCEILGFFGGDLSCNSECHLDTAGCYNFNCSYASRVQVGLIQSGSSPYLNEASGLVQSRTEPLVFWSHQDNSGDERLFALNKTGAYLGTYDLRIYTPGTTTIRTARDPEDIAIGPGPEDGIDYIYLGDTGDNWPDSFADFWIWRLPEPSVNPQQPFQTYTLNEANGVELIRYKFPIGHVGKDVESLMIDPKTKDLYLATKHSNSTTNLKIFRLPYPQLTNGTIMTLQEVADLPWSGQHILTGGDISENGNLIILRRYPDGFIWVRNYNQTVAEAIDSGYLCEIDNLQQNQGEAVAFDIDNTGSFYITSESDPDGGSPPQPIFYFRKT